MEETLKPSSLELLSTNFRNPSQNLLNLCKHAQYLLLNAFELFVKMVVVGRRRRQKSFKSHLINKLTKKEVLEDSVDEVVGIGTEIFTTFSHKEYGGPGNPMVAPFMDKTDAINKQGLPGSLQAACAAIKCAQNHVD